MDKNGTCDQHLGLALSCGKIPDIYDNVIALRSELKEDMSRVFAMESRITTLETKSRERWQVQKWWNVTFAGGLLGIGVALWIEWMKFHG